MILYSGTAACSLVRKSLGSTTLPCPSDRFSAAVSYKGGFGKREAAHRASKVLPSTTVHQSLSAPQPLSAYYKAVDCYRWHPFQRAMDLSIMFVVASD